MIQKSLQFRIQSVNYFSRKFFTLDKKWDIFASVLLERLPVIAPELNIIEKTMNEVTLKYEQAKSLLSDHEIRKIKDKERLERLTLGKEVDTKDLDAAAMQSAQEFEDENLTKLAQFKFGNRLTIDDESGNQHTLNRKLDRRLMLLFNLKFGNNYQWLLPQAKNKNNETLRETAMRAISQGIKTDNFKVRFLGNAPIGVYSYRYSKKLAQDTNIWGGKIFFYKAFYSEGDILKEDLNFSVVSDFLWLTREEAQNILKKKYWKSLNSCLFLESMSPNHINKIIQIVKNKKSEKVQCKESSLS